MQGRVTGCHSGPVAKNFSPDFYVTCATVIPVLFLAVAVQGRTYVNYASDFSLSFAFDRNRDLWGAWWLRDLIVARMLLAIAGSWLAVITAIAVAITCALGEGLAVYVLYQGSEPTFARPLVLVATLLLMVIAFAGPFLTIGSERQGRQAELGSTLLGVHVF